VASATFSAAKKGSDDHLETAASFAEMIGKESLITISTPDLQTAIVWFWTDERIEAEIDRMMGGPPPRKPPRKKRK
jgi:hypothetical protein